MPRTDQVSVNWDLRRRCKSLPSAKLDKEGTPLVGIHFIRASIANYRFEEKMSPVANCMTMYDFSEKKKANHVPVFHFIKLKYAPTIVQFKLNLFKGTRYISSKTSSHQDNFFSRKSVLGSCSAEKLGIMGSFYRLSTTQSDPLPRYETWPKEVWTFLLYFLYSV